jgi:5-methyltetrahydrofolate--homocysteine methyltransferase
MKKLLHDAALERRLVCDGAMGTQLMLAGLEQGGSGEYWNLTHADRVLGIQRRYVEAGADCLITNTFGGSRLMLKRHGHAGDVRAINQAGARIAREAFGDRSGYLLGDLVPLGDILEPYGDLPAADAQSAYEEQASALIEAGVDAIIIETQTSLKELGVAIDAAKAAGTPCIIASLAYDLLTDKTFYLTMMGGDARKSRRIPGGKRSAHCGAELRHRHGHDRRGEGGAALSRELHVADNGAAQCRPAGPRKSESGVQAVADGHGARRAGGAGRRHQHYRLP